MNIEVKKSMEEYSKELEKASYYMTRALAFEEVGARELFEKEIHTSRKHFDIAMDALHKAASMM